MTHSVLMPGVAAGAGDDAAWQPLAGLAPLIVVGVTGVGKSTTIAELARAGLHFVLLPDRRQLTDDLIIAHVQAMDGRAALPVRDRTQRFDYTRRYRELYPGGMAHALAQLRVGPVQAAQLLLFDGLRGVNEVSHAAALLPNARFVALHAPDVVRVKRLLGRHDAFDHISAPARSGTDSGGLETLRDLGIDNDDGLFDRSGEQELLDLVRTGAVDAEQLRAKLLIVIEERRNYDPDATLEALRNRAPSRSWIFDTTRLTPVQIAASLMQAFGAATAGNRP